MGYCYSFVHLLLSWLKCNDTAAVVVATAGRAVLQSSTLHPMSIGPGSHHHVCDSDLPVLS